MGVKKFIKKSVAFVAAAAMALTMVVAPVGAGVSYAEETEKDPVHVNKTAELQSNGTYKLTLESWAEGTATTTTTKSGVPLDIVLVLDQSGSMSGNVDALKKSVTSFVNTISGNAKEYNVDHRIAIAGYASNKTDGSSNSGTISPGSSDSSWVNTGLFVDGELKNYESSSGYKKVYSSELDKNKTYYFKISILGFSTYKEIRYKDSEWGYNILGFWHSVTPKKNDNDSGTQVYEYIEGNPLTDQDYKDSLVNVNTNSSVTSSITTAIDNIAASGATRTQYGMEMANKVFENNPLEEGSNRKRIVVVFTDGEPGQTGYDSTEAGNTVSKSYKAKQTYGATVYTVGFYSNADNDVTNFMNYLSSNYPNAQSMSQPGTKVTDKYYMTTSNSSKLQEIFTNISQDIVSGNIQTSLSNKSIVRDIVSDNFDLPRNFDKDKNIKVYTSTCTAYNANGKHTWGDLNELKDASVILDKDNKTIDVSGFAYDKEYLTPKVVTGRKDLGKKLVVVITNVTANKSGLQLDTNKPESAIYNPVEGGEDTLIKAFPQPKVDIPNHSYVLDYGKSVVSNTIQKDCGISKVDLCNTVKPSPYEKSTDGKYGTFNLGNVANGGTITYTPGKINWDGFDSAYVFGAVNKDEYLWSAVNFIPATSVYYEDDFGTDGNKNSNVAIVWGGNWDTIGTSKKGTQSSENIQYGWDDSYKDDTTYSNGSAHKTTLNNDNPIASATFTFTGTGVDVYTKTDATTGTVVATLYKVENGEEIAQKGLVMDNKSVKDYYQIPTLYFSGLEYGTYKVEIDVTTGAGQDRSTYYIDGIRVYNPLGRAPSDPIVKNAYNKAGEYNATVKTVRDVLLDAKTFNAGSVNNGAVFIDETNDEETKQPTATSGTTSDVLGTYKDIGPKNEVYLGPNQAIAFEINSGYEKLFIGAKAPNGVTKMVTTDEENAKGIDITSASDMYYPITAKDAGNGKKYVVIKNTGSNILSITKIRATGAGYSTLNIQSSDKLVEFASTFSSLPIADTDASGMVISKDNGNVDIDNSGDKDNNQQEENNNNNTNKPNSFWDKVMNSFKHWFR